MRRTVWIGGAACLVLLLTVLVAGWRPVVLLSDALAPEAPAGSLLLARPVAPHDLGVGDVVTVPLDESGRVTHRVTALEESDGTTWARLRGDAADVPGPGRIALEGPTLRAVVVVPGLGRVVDGGDPLLLAGIGLLLVGTAGLALISRREDEPSASLDEDRVARLPTGRHGVDTRVVALLATVEALGADGTAPETLEALARARTGALLGLGAVEHSPHAAHLDDGALFVVMALADADPAALDLVPPGSRRALEARAAVAAWWGELVPHVPRAVRSELDAVLTAVAAQGGIGQSRPVD